MPGNEQPTISHGIIWTVLLAFSVGCDPAWEVSGEVIITEAASQEISYPAKVFVHYDKTAADSKNTVNPREGGFAVGMLCEPPEAKHQIRWKQKDIGCAVRTKVVAWVETVQIDETTDCESELQKVKQNRQGNLFPSAEIVPRSDSKTLKSETTIFHSFKEPDCSSHSTLFTLESDSKGSQ